MSHPEPPAPPTDTSLESIAQHLRDMHDYHKAVNAYMESFHTDFMAFQQTVRDSRGPNKPLPPLPSEWPTPKPI